MEYFIFISFFATFTLINLYLKDNAVIKIIYYFLILLVAFFIGLRGIEDEYTRLYVRVPSLMSFFSQLDPVGVEKGYLFALICSILKTFGCSSQSLLLVFALTSVTIHAVYYRKFTKYYILAFLVYMSHEMYFHEWSGIRMGLASALIMPMIYCLVNEKKKSFYCLLLISIFIQYVAILSIILNWLRNKIKTKYLVLGLILSVIISYSGFFKESMLFFSNLGLLPKIIQGYVHWDVYSYDIGIFHLKTFQQIIVLTFSIYVTHRFHEHPSPYFNLIFNTYYISTILFIVFSDIAIFATRIAAHFYVVEPIMLAYLARFFVQKKLYSVIVINGAIIIAAINYILRPRLPSYNMFLINPF